MERSISARADPLQTGKAFYRVSHLLSVPWIRTAIFDTALDDRWEQRAAQALSADLTRALHEVLLRVMRAASDDGADAVDRALATADRDVERYRTLLEEIRGEDRVTMSSLSVAVREITVLSERLAVASA